MSTPKVFITSGEGFTAFYSARELVNEKVEVHVGAKDISELEDLKKMDIKIHEVDHHDKNSIQKALKGMDSVLMIPPTSHKKVEISKHYIDVCKEQKIKNVVLISSLGVYESDYKNLHNFKILEDYAMDQGLQNVCILRAGFYVQNILLYKQQLAEKHVLPAPAGDGKFAPINLKDVAKGCAALLSKGNLESKHRNQVYALTGSESLNLNQMCERASKILGTEIRYRDISFDEAKKLLSQVPWLDSSEAEYLLEMYHLVKENKLDMVSNDFQHICGKPPTPLDEFWKENKDELC